MTCEKIRQLSMDPELAPEVRRHLAECSACRDAVREHAQLLQVMDEWTPQTNFSADFETALRARIRAAEAAPARGWRRWLSGWHTPSPARLSPPRLVVTGALCSVLLIGAVVFYQIHRPQPKPAAPVARMAQSDPVVHDLQVLDQDSDMLENYNFLNGTPSTANPDHQTRTP